MSKIKTRDTVRDVKTLDRAANLSQRVKDTATKTKETAEAEQPEQESRHTSPTAYATDRIADGGKAIAHKAQGAVRHPVRRVRRSSQEVQRAAQDAQKAYQQLRTSGKATTAPKAAKATKVAKTAVTPVGKTTHTSVVQFAVDKGYNGIYIYLDNGEGGHHVNRPAFTQLNNDILAGKVQTVMVKDLSRIARNFILVDRWMKMADTLGVEVVSMADAIGGLEGIKRLQALILEHSVE